MNSIKQGDSGHARKTKRVHLQLQSRYAITSHAHARNPHRRQLAPRYSSAADRCARLQALRQRLVALLQRGLKRALAAHEVLQLILASRNCRRLALLLHLQSNARNVRALSSAECRKLFATACIVHALLACERALQTSGVHGDSIAERQARSRRTSRHAASVSLRASSAVFTRSCSPSAASRATYPFTSASHFVTRGAMPSVSAVMRAYAAECFAFSAAIRCWLVRPADRTQSPVAASLLHKLLRAHYQQHPTLHIPSEESAHSKQA
jgi:hypothetical protein